MNYVVGKEASSAVLLSLGFCMVVYLSNLHIYICRDKGVDNALCIWTYGTMPNSSLTLREGVYCSDSRLSRYIPGI